MELSESWNRLLADHWTHISSENVDIIKPQELTPDKRTFGLVFKVPKEASQQIEDYLRSNIPVVLHRKTLLQPAVGYHFTIQWTREESIQHLDFGQAMAELQGLFAKTPPLTGDILYPYFGRAGLLGILKTKTDTEMLSVRQQVQALWEKFGLPLAFGPQYYDLAYLSLTRYAEELATEEKLALKNIEKQRLPNIVFNEAQIVLNDKFMTPENTRVYGKLPLGA